eukprot:gnl/Trimastix_PCT/4723.p1 GENE.gnl/Trimastix_PCT/4723~~gnl/Trimastix_PCT/4723.p1  ORF type:complete len:310 (+),score=12.19 gnl/Trimastix_PCT/4723:43-930(+)
MSEAQPKGARSCISRYLSSWMHALWTSLVVVLQVVLLMYEGHGDTLGILGDIFFQIFFTLEIIARFTFCYRSWNPRYIPSWDWIDLFITFTCWFRFADPALKALAAFRLVRLMSILPKTKAETEAIFHSVVAIVQVLSVLLIFFIIFGILGVQFFGGALNGRCIRNGTTPSASTLLNDRTCNKNPASTDGYHCPANFTCMPYHNPQHGWMHFDNIGASILTVFQSVTQVGWTDNMYIIFDSGSTFAWLFFLASIILGSQFLMNMLTAVLCDSFQSRERSAVWWKWLECGVEWSGV